MKLLFLSNCTWKDFYNIQRCKKFESHKVKKVSQIAEKTKFMTKSLPLPMCLLHYTSTCFALYYRFQLLFLKPWKNILFKFIVFFSFLISIKNTHPFFEFVPEYFRHWIKYQAKMHRRKTFIRYTESTSYAIYIVKEQYIKRDFVPKDVRKVRENIFYMFWMVFLNRS